MDEEVLSLRKAWSQVVLAKDYETHMAAVGQSPANAALVRDLVIAQHLAPGSRILFAGCGPGQFLELVSADYLLDHTCVFCDLNAEFVAITSDRARAAGLHFEARVDDVEATGLAPGFHLIVMVLVLEHTDWQLALRQMAGLKPENLLLVIQRNPADMGTMVTPHRELPGSLKACASGEKPHLIDPAELESFLRELEFELIQSDIREVVDGKAMCGYVFRRGPT